MEESQASTLCSVLLSDVKCDVSDSCRLDQTLEPPKFCTPPLLARPTQVACDVLQAITGHLKVGQGYSVSIWVCLKIG